MDNPQLFGAIEAGGTKFVCLVGSGPQQIESQVRIETTTPDETLNKVVNYFLPYVQNKTVKSIGVGCFGPVDLNPNSKLFGFITSTPKPGWPNTDVAGFLHRELNIPIIMETDVNAAAIGEFNWGASLGCDTSLYITIGTGIGGGYLMDGKPLFGLLTPEMGHIHIPHDFNLDPFPGSCPFHKDCFEGLASGPAIQKRFNIRGETISDDDPFWEIEAAYISAALADYILVLSPKKIILGGGIMQRSTLFPKIRKKLLERLNGYVQSRTLTEDIASYIVSPGLGTRSGVIGALTLAMTQNK
jgi:fructokinase